MFLQFKNALLYARALKLGTREDWQEWSKSGTRPTYIPSTPDQLYKDDGWQSYGHWLGSDNVSTKYLQFLPFKQALVYVRSLNLKNVKEWRDWAKTGSRPADMPSNPNTTYKDKGWQGYGHWLGTGNVRGNCQQFLPFQEALLYARSLKLRGQTGWREWHKIGARPANIPSNPHATYKDDGWQGWGHWFGTGTVAHKDQQFLPFQEALVYARILNLKNVKEWEAWSKTGGRPANMPSTPHRIYKHDGWQGWGHWLGTGTISSHNQQFLPFKQALVYARFLMLKGKKDWEEWSKSGARPTNIPSNPHATYKDDGWQGWGPWLGTDNVGVRKDQQFLPFQEALVYARSLKLENKKGWEAWSKSGLRPANIPSTPQATYKHDGWKGYGYWLGTCKKVK